LPRDYSRRDFNNDAFQPVASGLGRVALSWNDLLVSLSGLFASIFATNFKIQNQLIPNTIWHNISSDRDQIRILEALASSRAFGIVVPKELRNQIQWVAKRAQILLDVRNDLLHSPFVSSDGFVTALHLGSHRRALKYDPNADQSNDVLDDCEWFYSAAIIVRNWTDHIDEALRYPDHTLPVRPQWRDRPNRRKSHRR
jgi:hypothetical protein